MKPDGTIYVWLYWHVPGLKFKVRRLVRRAVVPFPLAVRKAAAYGWVPVTKLLGSDYSLREIARASLDFFTPKYRWEHTPAEVEGWFQELGFSNVFLSTESVDGFGMRASR